MAYLILFSPQPSLPSSPLSKVWTKLRQIMLWIMCAHAASAFLNEKSIIFRQTHPAFGVKFLIYLERSRTATRATLIRCIRCDIFHSERSRCGDRSIVLNHAAPPPTVDEVLNHVRRRFLRATRDGESARRSGRPNLVRQL